MLAVLVNMAPDRRLRHTYNTAATIIKKRTRARMPVMTMNCHISNADEELELPGNVAEPAAPAPGAGDTETT